MFRRSAKWVRRFAIKPDLCNSSIVIFSTGENGENLKTDRFGYGVMLQLEPLHCHSVFERDLLSRSVAKLHAKCADAVVRVVPAGIHLISVEKSDTCNRS